MRSSLVVVALVAVALSSTDALAQRGRRADQSAAAHGWVSSLAQGKRLASQSGKPLMVVLRCQP
jgi:hypothetical protein